MTCIVGIIDKKQKKVFIGADSAGVGGLDITIRRDPKVFKVDEFVIGCTSSFRMIQLIRYSFHPPKIFPDADVYMYMCTDFINSLRRCFKEGGFISITDNVEKGGTFLVGIRERLFSIQNDFQVAESSDDFDSCGCGSSYALGVMKILSIQEISVEEKINKSLEVATHFSAGVRPPFIIEST